jgi:hypothetical protein
MQRLERCSRRRTARRGRGLSGELGRGTDKTGARHGWLGRQRTVRAGLRWSCEAGRGSTSLDTAGKGADGGDGRSERMVRRGSGAVVDGPMSSMDDGEARRAVVR